MREYDLFDILSSKTRLFKDFSRGSFALARPYREQPFGSVIKGWRGLQPFAVSLLGGPLTEILSETEIKEVPLAFVHNQEGVAWQQKVFS